MMKNSGRKAIERPRARRGAGILCLLAAGGLFASGGALPALAAEPSQLVEILSDPNSILRVIPALPDDLKMVDPTVVRVFLYNERKREDTDSLAAVVENRLYEELLRIRRFKVVESREAKIPRIQADGKTFVVSNTIESLARLRQVGDAVGADAVLMYAPQIQEKMVLVNAKLIRVSDGEVLWTDRFAYNFDLVKLLQEEQAKREAAAKVEAEKKRQEEARRTHDDGFYIGGDTLLLGVRRKSTANAALDLYQYPSFGFNMDFMHATYSDDFTVGLDVMFTPTGFTSGDLVTLRGSVGLIGLLRLDSIWHDPERRGLFSLYAAPTVNLGVGAGGVDMPALGGRAGLMIKPAPDVYFFAGVHYVSPTTVTFKALSGYENTTDAPYGGMTFSLGAGVIR